MAKQDLIGGSLWEQYSRKVTDRMDHPQHLGELDEHDARRLGGTLVVADWGAEACGDAIRLFMIVNPETDVILDIRYKTFGCGTAIASSDIMTELCVGKTVDEALKITNIDVERALRDESDKPAIPPQKMHCSVMAYDVIKRAVSIYKGVDPADLERGDIVCECARVTLGTIKEVIRLNNLTTVEEITRYTKAGAFCKSCVRPGGHEKRKYYLEEILEQTRKEMEIDAVERTASARNFNAMNLIKKYKVIEEFIEREIRPRLAADGGDIEVVDLKEKGGKSILYISYMGACSHCPSSRTTTFAGIESILKDGIDESLEVVIV